MMLTDPILTTSANLIWQSRLNAGGSRRRLAVALLRDAGDGNVSFQYLRNTADFEVAESEGFLGYTGIPLERDDTSQAIETLGRRLMQPERPDYDDFLARFGLSRAHKLPTLSLLAYTGAKLTSDSFSVADTFENFNRPFEYIFEVAGRRHSIEQTPSPRVGDPVIFRCEPENQHDSNAVEMVDDMGRRYGYVNTCQARAVASWLTNGEVTGMVFRENGRKGYPRMFVYASVVPDFANRQDDTKSKIAG